MFTKLVLLMMSNIDISCYYSGETANCASESETSKCPWKGFRQLGKALTITGEHTATRVRGQQLWRQNNWSVSVTKQPLWFDGGWSNHPEQPRSPRRPEPRWVPLKQSGTLASDVLLLCDWLMTRAGQTWTRPGANAAAAAKWQTGMKVPWPSHTCAGVHWTSWSLFARALQVKVRVKMDQGLQYCEKVLKNYIS